MKLFHKSAIGLLVLLITFLLPHAAFAAPTLSISPASGYVVEGQRFTLDVMIDSDGEKISSARMVVTFDPTIVKLIKAERNQTLFKGFPSGQQTTDNKNGVVVLLGFTQSGEGELYQTSGSPDVLARLTFEAIKEGSVTFDWEHSGKDEPFKSVLIRDGSPPQNVLNSKPSSARFTIQDADGSSGGVVTTPVTGLFDDNEMLSGVFGMFGGLLIFAGSGVLYKFTRRWRMRNERTLVDFTHER